MKMSAEDGADDLMACLDGLGIGKEDLANDPADDGPFSPAPKRSPFESPRAESSTAEPSKCGASEVGTPRSGAALAEPPPVKMCVGCGCSSLHPSPLCGGEFRQGDYGDWSSKWCRHCASVSRIRYFDEHGSLAKIEEWLRASADNEQHFRRRVLSYYTLKLENVHRVSLPSLESRTSLLEMVLGWQRKGAGVPDTQDFGPKCVVDLKEAVAAGITNPFLDGGILCQLKSNNKFVLGVALPRSACGPSFSGVPKLLGDGGLAPMATASIASRICSHDDIRCEDSGYAQVFEELAGEYIQHSVAKEAAGAGGQQNRGQELKRVCGSAESMAVVKFSSRVGEVAASSSSKCDGEDSEKDETPAKKKRKGMPNYEAFDLEVQEKVGVLAQENWAALCCDKVVDGLLTRISNARAKLLDKMMVAEASPLNEHLSCLRAMVDFGNSHKKGYQKIGKDTALLDLVRPLGVLRENRVANSIKWHSSLKQVEILVKFQQHVAEDETARALRLLDIDRLVGELGEHDEPMSRNLAKARSGWVALRASVLSTRNLGDSESVETGKPNISGV